MKRFDEQVIAVVGVASEIGAAVSARLTAEGATVVGIDVREDGEVRPDIVADFTDEEQVRAAYASVVESAGRLDGVYNNIGRMTPSDSSVVTGDLDTWEEQLRINATALMLSCRHAIPLLTENPRGRGAIVNSASFLGRMGAATAPMAYSAAKAAVIQLTRDLGINLARAGIRVNSISFGPIETREQRAVLERAPEIMPRRIVHWPMGRYGTLDEAAGSVAFLLSDDAGFVTAHDLELDGGISRAFTVPE